MEVEAPLPCTEAGGRALLHMCGRWTDRYFFKNPILLLNPKQPPADILSDDNHEKSPVDITNWEEVKYDSIDGWTSEELKFTAMPSSEGGLDNYNGSHVLHVEEHLSIFGSTITAQDNISTALKNAPAATATTWIVASATLHHATGNRALLSDFTPEHSDIFVFGGEDEAMPMQVVGHGVVVTETMVLPDVWYVPGLMANLVSVSQLTELDYSVAFGRGKCYIRSIADGTIVGAAQAGEDGQFALDFLRVPLGL